MKLRGGKNRADERKKVGRRELIFHAKSTNVCTKTGYSQFWVLGDDNLTKGSFFSSQKPKKEVRALEGKKSWVSSHFEG